MRRAPVLRKSVTASAPPAFANCLSLQGIFAKVVHIWCAIIDKLGVHMDKYFVHMDKYFVHKVVHMSLFRENELTYGAAYKY